MRKSGKVLSLLTCFECTFLSHDFKCIQILVSSKIPLNLPQKRMKPRKLLNVCIFFHYRHIIRYCGCFRHGRIFIANTSLNCVRNTTLNFIWSRCLNWIDVKLECQTTIRYFSFVFWKIWALLQATEIFILF